jgi:hypothetical protein
MQIHAGESKPTADSWLDDHHKLRGLLRTFEGLRARQLVGSTRRLGDLLRRLERHFDWEEEAGLFSSFAERHPRFAAALARLQAEHAQILAEVRGLYEACRYQQEHGAREDLYPRLRSVLATIHRHEAEETEIVHRAYCEDIAASD